MIHFILYAPQTKDLIQLMLDAKLENRDGSNEDEILSTSTIASIVAGFLAASFETVTNLPSFTSICWPCTRETAV